MAKKVHKSPSALEPVDPLEETTSWAYPEGRRLIGFHVKEASESGTKRKTKR